MLSHALAIAALTNWSPSVLDKAKLIGQFMLCTAHVQVLIDVTVKLHMYMYYNILYMHTHVLCVRCMVYVELSSVYMCTH